jgi:hypothetical protein
MRSNCLAAGRLRDGGGRADHGWTWPSHLQPGTKVWEISHSKHLALGGQPDRENPALCPSQKLPRQHHRENSAPGPPIPIARPREDRGFDWTWFWPARAPHRDGWHRRSRTLRLPRPWGAAARPKEARKTGEGYCRGPGGVGAPGRDVIWVPGTATGTGDVLIGRGPMRRAQSDARMPRMGIGGAHGRAALRRGRRCSAGVAAPPLRRMRARAHACRSDGPSLTDFPRRAPTQPAAATAPRLARPACVARQDADQV